MDSGYRRSRIERRSRTVWFRCRSWYVLEFLNFVRDDKIAWMAVRRADSIFFDTQNGPSSYPYLLNFVDIGYSQSSIWISRIFFKVLLHFSAISPNIVWNILNVSYLDPAHLNIFQIAINFDSDHLWEISWIKE